MNFPIYTNEIEIWFVSFLLFVGVIFILFGKSFEKPFFGALILGGVIFIFHSQHTVYDHQQHVLKRFEEGKALDCGLWRGEGTLVYGKNGWKWEKEIGFVKGDTILKDPKLCDVIGETSPEPSSVPYWFLYVISLMPLFVLRIVTLKWREHFDAEVKRQEDEEAHAATPIKASEGHLERKEDNYE
ncbi:MAG: hypothetical protein NT103_02745 [Campylobacterales bacterium]|nr:hypothetical protein [Campylobacterales bacterium]